MVCFFQHIQAFHIFRKSVKFAGKSGSFNFIIGITISNYKYLPLQVDTFYLFNLSLILRKYVFAIETNNFLVIVKFKGIGKDIFFPDPIFCDNWNYEFFKTIGYYIDIFAVFRKKDFISNERGRDTFSQFFYKSRQV